MSSNLFKLQVAELIFKELKLLRDRNGYGIVQFSLCNAVDIDNETVQVIRVGGDLEIMVKISRILLYRRSTRHYPKDNAGAIEIGYEDPNFVEHILDNADDYLNDLVFNR